MLENRKGQRSKMTVTKRFASRGEKYAKGFGELPIKSSSKFCCHGEKGNRSGYGYPMIS